MKIVIPKKYRNRFENSKVCISQLKNNEVFLTNREDHVGFIDLVEGDGKKRNKQFVQAVKDRIIEVELKNGMVEVPEGWLDSNKFRYEDNKTGLTIKGVGNFPSRSSEWVIMVLMYSFLFKIALGLVWILGSIVGELYFRLGDLSWITQIIISIGAGVGTKLMIDEYKKWKKEEKEKEKYQNYVDERERRVREKMEP